MFCNKCGKEIPDGSVFCNFCGTAVPVSVQQLLPERKKAAAKDRPQGALSNTEKDQNGQGDEKSTTKKTVLIISGAASVVLIGIILAGVLLLKQSNGGGTDGGDSSITVSREATQPKADKTDSSTDAAQVPIMHPDTVVLKLDYNQSYQCTAHDFQLEYAVNESDITWTAQNAGDVLTCNQHGNIRAGNVQVSPEQGYNTAVSVQGTLTNGTVLRYEIQVGDGQTYNIYRSSKVLNMKRGKHYPYICDPGIENCLGFTMKFRYDLPEGDYVKNDWEVWIRENGDTWVQVDEIEVNEGEQKEYVIKFNRPITFTEIAVQHPIDYNGYMHTDSLTVSNILHG